MYVKKENKTVDENFGFSLDYAQLREVNGMEDESEEEELYDIEDTVDYQEESKEPVVVVVVETKDSDVSTLIGDTTLVDIKETNLFNTKSMEEKVDEEEEFKRFINLNNQSFQDDLKSLTDVPKKVTVPTYVEKHLSRLGFQIIGEKKVLPGESFFEAVSLGVYGVKQQSRNLRFETCSWLTDNDKFVSSDGRSLTFMTNLKWLEYCKGMTHMLTEGDLITINAIAQLLNVKVHLFEYLRNGEVEVDEIQPKIAEEQGKTIYLGLWYLENGEKLFVSLKVVKRFALLVRNDVPGQKKEVSVNKKWTELANTLRTQFHFKTELLKNLDSLSFGKSLKRFVSDFSKRKEFPIECILFLFDGISYNSHKKNFIVPFEKTKKKKYVPSKFVPVEKIFQIFNVKSVERIPKLFLFDVAKKISPKSCFAKRVDAKILPKNSLFFSTYPPGKLSGSAKPNTIFVDKLLGTLSKSSNKSLFQIVQELGGNAKSGGKKITYLVESSKKSQNSQKLPPIRTTVLKTSHAIEELDLVSAVILKKFLINQYLTTKKYNNPSVISQEIFATSFDAYCKWKFARNMALFGIASPKPKKGKDPEISKQEKEYRDEIQREKEMKKNVMMNFFKKEKEMILKITKKLRVRHDGRVKSLEGSIPQVKAQQFKKEYSNILRKKKDLQEDMFLTKCLEKFNKNIVGLYERFLEKLLSLEETIIQFKMFHFEILKDNIQHESSLSIEKMLKYFFHIVEQQTTKKFEMQKKLIARVVENERSVYKSLVQDIHTDVLKMVHVQLSSEVEKTKKMVEKKSIIGEYKKYKEILTKRMKQRKDIWDKNFNSILEHEKEKLEFSKYCESLALNRELMLILNSFSEELLRNSKTINKEEFSKILVEIFNHYKVFLTTESTVEKLNIIQKPGVNSKKKDVCEEKMEKTIAERTIKTPFKLLNSKANPNSYAKLLRKKNRSPTSSGGKSLWREALVGWKQIGAKTRPGKYCSLGEVFKPTPKRRMRNAFREAMKLQGWYLSPEPSPNSSPKKKKKKGIHSDDHHVVKKLFKELM